MMPKLLIVLMIAFGIALLLGAAASQPFAAIDWSDRTHALLVVLIAGIAISVYQWLGFVVTMNTARQLLLERRSIWSGLEGQLLSNELADMFNLPPKTVGFLVKAVAKGSPAEGMGIKGGSKTATVDGQSLVVGGDIILAVDGIPINTAADLANIRERSSRLKPAEPIAVTVLRAGRQVKLTGKMP